MLVAEGRPADGAATLNRAAARARGEILCFLDPLSEPLSADWLDEMAAHAVRPDVGAVGAKLLSPDGSIRHAGFILDPESVVRPIYGGAHQSHRGYIDRARLTQRLSAVGGGCLVVSRSHFDAVGGFASATLRGTLADIDLCLRLGAIGLRHVWTPHATVTLRNAPDSSGTAAGLADMRHRWAERLAYDPAFNPNLDLERNHPCLRFPGHPARDPISPSPARRPEAPTTP